MKKYIKNGVFYNGSTIEYKGMVIYNPTEEMLVKAGFEEYVEPEPEPEPEPTEEELAEMEAQRAAEEAAARVRAFDAAKASKLQEITEYDSSDSVNSFTYNGVSMWIPKELRISLMNSSTIEAASGKTDTTLWYDGVKFELPISTLHQLLAAIELYALECYNVTESHKAAVRALATIDEVQGYDITSGYPSRLSL